MPDEREFQSVVDEAEQAARAGDFTLADRRLRDALRMQEASLGADHPELASTLNNLAVVCETLSQFDDAERFYRRAYAIASVALPASDPLVVTSRENLKDFCIARGLPLEDWPGIGQFEAPSTALPPARPPAPPAPPATRQTPPRTAAPPPRPGPEPAPTTPAGPATRRDRAEPRAGAWPTRVIGAVLVLATIGTLVVVTSWRRGSPPPATVTPPSPAIVSPAAVDGPAGASPVVAIPAPERTPAPPPAAPTAAAEAPAGARVVVADVCRSLSTNGAWHCEPLGATAAPGRAAFYTRVASPRPLRVEHRWYQGTALRQRVTLAVGANPSAGYRTFSRQTLTPGAWRVELRAADGAVLHAAAFDIR